MPNQQEVFEAAHAHVAKWEGGYFDHPNDPGGVTMYGVSLMFLKGLDLWEGDIDGDGDIDRDDVLAVTKDTARDIFKRHFWDRPRAGEMPPRCASMTSPSMRVSRVRRGCCKGSCALGWTASSGGTRWRLRRLATSASWRPSCSWSVSSGTADSWRRSRSPRRSCAAGSTVSLIAGRWSNGWRRGGGLRDESAGGAGRGAVPLRYWAWCVRPHLTNGTRHGPDGSAGSPAGHRYMEGRRAVGRGRGQGTGGGEGHGGSCGGGTGRHNQGAHAGQGRTAAQAAGGDAA